MLTRYLITILLSSCLCVEYAINFKKNSPSVSYSLLENLSFEEKGNVLFSELQHSTTRSQREVNALLESRGIEYKSFWISNTIIIKNLKDEKILKEIEKFDTVESIEKIDDPIFLPPLKETNAILTNDYIEWNVKFISSEKAYQIGYYGQDVVVGVIDTGINHLHQDLKDKYRGKDGNHDYNWFDPTHTSINEPCDDNGHGTHVSGTIVGQGPTKQVGVAPNATIIACKSLYGDGKGKGIDALSCFQWMAAPTKINGDSPDPSKRPHIINNSWGSTNKHSFYDEALANLINSGVTVVFAAGNLGPQCQTVAWPGGHESVITVGALQKQSLEIAYFSSRGPFEDGRYIKPEIVAPGQYVTSCANDSTTGYKTYSGTSMATPAIVGAIALIWNIRPDLKGNHFKTKEYLLYTTQKIKSTDCESVNSSPNNVYGYGMCNISNIVKLCKGKQPDDPSLCSSNGVCINDVCICYNGWYGNECSIPSCFGRLGNDSQACNGKGKCVEPDKCDCPTGYTGDCTLPICFGLNATSPEVCNGKGKCVAPDDCNCIEGYLGDDCSEINSGLKISFSILLLSISLLINIIK